MSRAALVIVTAPLLVMTSLALAADDMAARASACRKIADAAQRLACYDRAVEDPFAPLRGTTAAPAPPAASAAAPPEARFGSENLKKAPPAPEDVDALSAKVTSVTVGGAGLETVTLDNGQIWRQTEVNRMYLKPGETVTLKRGLIGGYFMIPERLGSRFRVKRIQ